MRPAVGGGRTRTADRSALMAASPASSTATPARRRAETGRRGSRNQPNLSTRTEAACWPATVKPTAAAAPIAGMAVNTVTT